MKSNNRKNRGKQAGTLIVVGILIAVIASVRIAIMLHDYNGAIKLYDDASKAYVTHMPSGSSDGKIHGGVEESFTEETEKTEEINIDFDTLKQINPEAIGWIYFEDGSINYPIMYSGENEKYLTTTYTGGNASAGSIFLEGACNPNLSDYHTIIYGHNMNNGSMFGTLKNYANVKGYANSHRYFKIKTLETEYTYAVVSFKEVSTDDEIFTVYMDHGAGLSDFIQYHIMTGTLAEDAKLIQTSDTSNLHMLTLSTCSKGDRRFVVSAVRIK